MSGTPSTENIDGPYTAPSKRRTKYRAKYRGRGVGQKAPRESGSRQSCVQSNEYRPNTGISVLPHSEGTEITGGQFNAVGGNQIRVEVNVNGMDTKRPQEHMPLPAACDGIDIEAGGMQNVETAGSYASPPEFPGHSVRGGSSSRLVRPSNSAPYTIYFRCLATQERGSPLWIPEPNRQLPIEYQRNGLVIGDVGIITDQGCFDSLFNISLPPDDPLAINSDELPRNFVPLKIKPSNILKFSQFKKGTSLSSGSVSVTRNDSSSGLTFESSASEGAILTLPDGLNSEDLRNKKKLRDYLALHLEEFYRCALLEHGRDIKNGDLRVVTGFDKTTSWGMAAFLNSTSQTKPLFRLEFQPRDQGCVGQTLNWTSSGTAEVKAGPDTREVDALRMGDPSQQNVEYENQSVFVRTENATLSSSIWNVLSNEAGIPDLELDDNSDTPLGSHSGSSAPPGFGNFTTGGRGGQSSASSSYFGSLNTLTIHPSNGINAMLLELHPSARMAITGDDIWISVIEENDTILPSVETLYTRIMESYDVHLENGVAFLEKFQMPPISGTNALQFLSLPNVTKKYQPPPKSRGLPSSPAGYAPSTPAGSPSGYPYPPTYPVPSSYSFPPLGRPLYSSHAQNPSPPSSPSGSPSNSDIDLQDIYIPPMESNPPLNSGSGSSPNIDIQDPDPDIAGIPSRSGIYSHYEYTPPMESDPNPSGRSAPDIDRHRPAPDVIRNRRDPYIGGGISRHTGGGFGDFFPRPGRG